MLNQGSTGHITSQVLFISQNTRIVGVGSDLWRSPWAGDTGTHPRGFGMTPDRDNPNSAFPGQRLHGRKFSLTLRWNSSRFGTWGESDPGLRHQTRSQSPTGSAGSGSGSRLGHSSPAIPINTSQQVWKQPGTLMANAGLGSAAFLEARKTNPGIKELQGQALQSSRAPAKLSSARAFTSAELQE